MSPEKQRIAIAEACGWRRWDLSPQQDRPWMTPQGVTANERDMPNYRHDLNAMHEAEMAVLLKEQTATYYGIRYCSFLTALRNAATVFGPKGSVIAVNESKVVSATAAQRAEALLRAIGRWEE